LLVKNNTAFLTVTFSLETNCTRLGKKKVWRFSKDPLGETWKFPLCLHALFVIDVSRGYCNCARSYIIYVFFTGFFNSQENDGTLCAYGECADRRNDLPYIYIKLQCIIRRGAVCWWEGRTIQVRVYAGTRNGRARHLRYTHTHTSARVEHTQVDRWFIRKVNYWLAFYTYIYIYSCVYAAVYRGVEADSRNGVSDFEARRRQYKTATGFRNSGPAL